MHEYLLIQDDFQLLRIKWILGKQTLALSSRSKKIIVINSYAFDERVHNFDSPLNVEGGSSLLEKIFIYYKKLQNYSMISLREILTLCNMDKNVRDYIFGLASPVLTFSSYIDFFPRLFEKYLSDSQTVYNYYAQPFNKEELGKEVKELYQKAKIKYESEKEGEKGEEKVEEKGEEKENM